MRIVTSGSQEDGYAKVRTLDEFDDDMKAAKVSLGVLGVISQVTLKLQPLFKRSVTFLTKNDTDLSDQVATFGRQHEFADITWYPSQKQVVYRIDDRVSSNVSGNGLWDHPGFRATPSLALLILRSSEEDQEAKGDVAGKCRSGKLTTNTLIKSAFGMTNDGIIFKGYPVIGYQNRLQASGGCLKGLKDSEITSCPWDPRVKGLFFHQTTFSIAISKAKDFIQDIQKLVSIAPQSLCGIDLYNGILVRYVAGSNAYIGTQEDSLDFDITYYRSKDPKTPRLYEDVLEEIEQMAVFKYDGLPHWGKNRNAAFKGAIEKYKKGKEFLKVKDKYDPLSLFSSEWTDQVLGLKDGLTIVKEGCALEGLCVCSEDVHCAPQKGYLCRPGKLFKEARVCTLVKITDQGSSQTEL
ncbi:putative truncated L-gulonolactone oxidase 7, mitochondrial [Bidens hawaiensis]|uniref:putative truncated L-gulonolactone oxidase 7, mitochondrial n=1 Tax=Bidens hawaiensis TaxID=980011 RepID=UPI00404AAB70